VLATAEPVAWRIVSVHDGDTLRVLDAGGTRGTVDVPGPVRTARASLRQGSGRSWLRAVGRP
jgi:hypothetical protein